jgi:dATP pyrophosphohydrolase
MQDCRGKVSMQRAPYQVLVLPFRRLKGSEPLYAIFRRADCRVWQGIAGGGQSNESPLESARREAFEEGGIPRSSSYFALDSLSTIPVVNICGFKWGPDVLVIPEHSFGVRMNSPEITLSTEHSECRWVPYAAAYRLLEWNSNKNALWELDTRIRTRKLVTERRPAVKGRTARTNLSAQRINGETNGEVRRKSR